MPLEGAVQFGVYLVETLKIVRATYEVARSVAMPLVVHVVPRSIPAFGAFFHEDLVMKKVYGYSSPSADSRRASKECMLSTGKLPLIGLPVRITDRPDMSSAVCCGRKALK